MGRISSRQGSALSHALVRAPRLGIALGTVFVLGLLAAAPAMAAEVSVSGGTLTYLALPGERNNLRIEQAGDTFTVSDSVPVTAGGGCSPVLGDETSATCSGVSAVRVNVRDLDDTVEVNSSVPSEIFGQAGDDTLTASGTGRDVIDGKEGADTLSVRGPGPDTVVCDAADPPAAIDSDDVVSGGCSTNVSPVTTIQSGPEGATDQASHEFRFAADETDVSFECFVAGLDGGESGCATPHAVTAPGDGSYVFNVRAVDDGGPGPWASRAFIVDTTPPQVTISGPQVSTTATPTFTLSAPSEADVTFECALGSGTFAPCAAQYTTPALPNGDYVLQVRGTDRAGNICSPTSFLFTVSVSPGGGGGTPAPPVAPRLIIIDSLVLIAGNPVKMSRRGVVGIRLTCAGKLRCKGRMRITTAEPVTRKSRKLVTLGSKRFSIGANEKRKVKVRFSKSKRRLAKRLKRFKAKVVINEFDQRGNPRISSRVFILRAR